MTGVRSKGPGLPESQGKAAAHVPLPVCIIQILPKARHCKRVLKSREDLASAGLTRVQAFGPMGACVRKNKLFIVHARNGPFVSRLRVKRPRVGEIQRCSHRSWRTQGSL